MKKMSIRLLCLGLLCGVARGQAPWESMPRDPGIRKARAQELERKLRHDGVKYLGIWDLTDDNSLRGMFGHGALWSKICTKIEGSYDSMFNNSATINNTMFNKNGKLFQYGIIDEPFTFNTCDDIRNLAKKLYSGKALSKAYLVFFKLTCGYLRDIPVDILDTFRRIQSCVTFLCLDPSGFFFSHCRSPFVSKGCVPYTYWTMDKDFYQEAMTRAAVEREEIQASLEARLKALEDRPQSSQSILDMVTELSTRSSSSHSPSRTSGTRYTEIRDSIVKELGSELDKLKPVLYKTHERAEQHQTELDRVNAQIQLLEQKLQATEQTKSEELWKDLFDQVGTSNKETNKEIEKLRVEIRDEKMRREQGKLEQDRALESLRRDIETIRADATSREERATRREGELTATRNETTRRETEMREEMEKMSNGLAELQALYFKLQEKISSSSLNRPSHTSISRNTETHELRYGMFRRINGPDLNESPGAIASRLAMAEWDNR